MTITVAVDAMGGDFGPEVTIPASLQFLRSESDTRLILVGDINLIKQHLGECPDVADRIELQMATHVVAMDEPPAQALKKKKDSSMRIAINMVKEGRAQAAVSAGNTGALMATARFVLKMIAGVDRPAICAELPTIEGHVRMLDLGANVDSSPDMLHQFAVMGSVLTSEVDHIESPSLGLLNIGEEDIKGSEVVKKAGELIAGADLNYAGFIEADEIYSGKVDIVVCDGFAGNVSLKTSEGVAQFVMNVIREEFTRNIWTKLAVTLAMPMMSAARKRLDPRRYNGATLLGLRGTVIKSHGGADAMAFEHALHEAADEAAMAIPERIEAAVSSRMASSEAINT